MSNSYFSKMALIWIRYEPMSLVVNDVCFGEEQDILNRLEIPNKSQGVTD